MRLIPQQWIIILQPLDLKKRSPSFLVFIPIWGLRYTDSEYDSYRGVTIASVPFLVPYVAQTDGVGFMGRAGLSYRDELNSASLSLAHDMQPASGSSGTVERTSLQCSLGRRIAERSRISFSTGYTLNKSTDTIAYVSATDESSWWVRPSISYSLTPELSVVGSYNYASVQDKQGNEDRERNLFMVRLEYRYSFFD